MSARRAIALLLVVGAAFAGDAGDARAQARATAEHLLASYVFIAGGSGVVVSADGLVLTNNHVVDGEIKPDGSIEVRFAGGETRGAHLLGLDPVGDIALLRIDDASGLAHAEIAPAEALKPGMAVVAVGNPFGLGEADSVPSVSEGVLSTARIVRDDYTDALQVDAPVNPGNSGGPLFDRDGRVLGINGQIRTLSGMRINSGVGLSICCTQLSAFLPLLRDADGGYVHHTAKPKDLQLAAREDGGVRVVEPGSSPLRKDDRVVAIAGRPVASLPAAEGLFESLPWTSGVTTLVRVRRADGESDVEVPLARKTIPGRPYHGVTIALDDRGRVAIEHVDEDSPAQKAGVHVDDVLVAVGETKITRKLDWLKALAKLEVGDRLALKLTRGDVTVDAAMMLRQRE